MPEPEAAGLGEGRAGPDWALGLAYRGLRDGRYFPSPDACFAANRQCEQVFTIEPLPYHCRPVQPDTRSLCADLDADDPACDFYYGHADSDADADPVRGDLASGAGDGDSSSPTEGVRAHNRDTRDAGSLLLDVRPAHTDVDPDTATVPDARAGDAVPEGK